MVNGKWSWGKRWKLGPGSCWLALMRFGHECVPVCAGVCRGVCKKKYDTHKLKLAANLRWHRRMRIVLYLFGGIKPLKKRRHKTPQAIAITLGFPFSIFRARFLRLFPAPLTKQSNQICLALCVLHFSCQLVCFSFSPFLNFSSPLADGFSLSLFGNAA